VHWRNSAADAADLEESTLLDSVTFNEAQIQYIIDNFERSPAAALAFTTANTGICKKPADLGPLLDGVPDSIVERCVQRFKKSTDLACIHACACCGLRTNDCKLISVDQMASYAMTPAEVDAFALENATLQQVRSTCLLRGVRYWMHPELVNLDSGTAWRCAACTNSKGHVHPLSVRGGCDFGNVHRITEPRLPKLTLVEECILRRSRCYRHYIKCLQPGSCTKLKGHVVLVQQDRPDALVDSLRDRVTSARDSIAIIFGGSHKLLTEAHAARSMAHVLDARKPVLLQWLEVLNLTSPEHACPQLTADLRAPGAEALLVALQTQIVDAAVTDDTDLMSRVDGRLCDDVAAVRNVNDDDMSEHFDRVCIMPRNPGMSVEEQRRRETAAIHSAVKISVDASLENEFREQRYMLSRAFPWVFPLGAASSFPHVTATLSDAEWTHVFNQSSCVAAQDGDLLFFVIDQKRRHSIVRSAAAAVAPGHVQKFQDVVDSPEFIEDRRLAGLGDSQAAERVTKALRPIMTIACARVVNGPVQRAKAQEHILAMVHELGLPSMFLTVSPDFVHSAGAIRMSIPEANTEFPLAAFLDSLGSGGMFSASGWNPLNLGTASLNVHMANNPLAAARDFVSNMNAVMNDLLCCPSHESTRKTPVRWRACGVFGTPWGFYCVVEAQGRGALHYHLLFWGSYAPHILSQAASDPDVKDRILKALSTQTVAELPREMHIQRLHRRATIAAGGSAPASVRQSRLPGDLLPVMAAIKTRALKAADASCVHGHSGTCHNNNMGKHCCRMCKPENPCQYCQFTFTYLSAERTTHVIPDAPEECTDRRDLAVHPLPAIDHRCIVIEPPRRRDDVPLTELETAGLSQRSSVWLKQMLPLQNMLVSAFNLAIMACVPANQAAIQMSCDNSAKQMAFYLSNYVGKDSNALKVTASMLLAAQNHIKNNKSIAPDSGSAIRTATHLLTNTCNRVMGAMEVSDQQAAMTVLGYTADLSSAPFWTCMVMPAVRYAQQLLPPVQHVSEQLDGAVGEHMQALEMDAPAILDGPHDVSEAVYTAGDSLQSVPQHIHYALRGNELSVFSLYDYCRLINIRPITAKDGNDTGQGRQCNGKFRFDEAHPLAESHIQVLRSKIATVVVRPSPPRMPEFDHQPPFQSGPKAKQAETAAAYYSVLLRPWSIDALPQTDYNSWAEWAIDLSSNPTAVNQYRMAVMVRMSQGMSTSAENLKISKAYRFKSARRWGTTGIDGTEAPPGIQEPDHVSLSQPDAADATIDASLDELERMVNPSLNAAALATYKQQVEHVSCCMKQLKSLFPISRDRVMQSDSGELLFDEAQVSPAIPDADHVSSWTHAAAHASSTMKFLKQALEEDADEHASAVARVLPAEPDEDQWPSQENLTPSQAAAVRAVRPYIANRATPPNTFLMTGGPGAGKSYTIKHMKKIADAAGVRMRCGAFAAAAAMPLPHGQTLHSLVGVGAVSDVFPPPPSHNALTRLRSCWKDVGLFVIDEISMVNRPLLGIVSHRLSLIRDRPEPFGGLCTVLSGDFNQLPSIPEPGLAAAVVAPPLDTRVGSPSALADSIFTDVTLLPLVEQKRCEDVQWNAMLDECRSSGTLIPLVNSLKVLSAAEVQQDPAWQFATIATTGNELRAHINSLQATRWAAHTGRVKIRWKSTVNKWIGYAPSDEDWAACEDPRFFGEFIPGLEVVINDNVSAESTEKGVANGRKAVMFGISYDDPNSQDAMLRQLNASSPGDVITLASPPDYVILDVGLVDGTGGRDDVVINPETGGLLLPLKADPAGGKKLRVVINGDMYRLKLNSFDYDMLFCVTFHKLQGMTLDRLILDLRKPVYPPHHTHEMALVAASRVRQGAHVRVLTPGWSHLCECKSDIRIRAWLTGFSGTGGVWNRARAIEEFSMLQANAPSDPKRRRVNRPSDSSSTVPPGNAVAAAADASVGSKRARVTSACVRPAVSGADAPCVAQEGQRNQRPRI
jgi:hypothetical protein